MRTSLLIVDDHRVFCQGLEAVFAGEPDFEPMAISNPAQALGVVAAQRPDVVLMDLRLGEVSGIDLTRQMTALRFPPAVVVLTAYADTATALAAIRAGAVGFLAKNASVEQVLSAVRAAAYRILANLPGITSLGTVTDPQQAAVEGATVELRNVGTNEVRTQTTNSAGQYSVPGVTPGVYKISVTRTGFRSHTVDNFRVDVNKSYTLDFKLELGQASRPKPALTLPAAESPRLPVSGSPLA